MTKQRPFAATRVLILLAVFVVRDTSVSRRFAALDFVISHQVDLTIVNLKPTQ
jgi:hypothetical protein